MDRKSTAWQVEVRMMAKGMRRSDLAKSIGISNRNFYMAISGRTEFSLSSLLSMAKIFDCNIEDLLQEIPETYK